MKQILSIALVFCILLCACASADDPEPQHAAAIGVSAALGSSLSVQPLSCGAALGLSESPLGYSEHALGLSTTQLPEEEAEEEELPTADGSIASLTPRLGLSIAEMRARNPDTVGWLIVPGTTVDTPVVINPEGDNNYYTTHNFNRVPDRNGAYGTDFRCDLVAATRETLQRNATIYAHNFTEDPNGALFAQLKKYKDPEFAATHPYLYFSTPVEDMVWQVFAVFDSNTDLPYIVPDLPWDIYSRILDVAYDASIYDYGVTVTDEDRILTLSTCSFVVPGRDPIPLSVNTRYRFVVMARLVRPDEPILERVELLENLDPLPPDRMPPIYHPGLDVFCFDGAIYATDPRWGLTADFTGAVERGEILRTNISYDMVEGDATSLPVGSRIIGYTEWDEVVGVERDGEIVPYIRYLSIN